MREDMHKVIVDHPRYGGKCSEGTRARTRYRGHEDADAVVYAPTQRKKLYREPKVFGDRLHPLYQYLLANCGRPWRLVYSEICAHADSRSIMQHHLREHVLGFVLTAPSPDFWGFRRFHVDGHGILRKTARKLYARPEPKPSPWLRTTETEGYLVENGCYYHITLSYAPSVSGPAARLWGLFEAGSEYVSVRKRALSTKDIQRLGLRERLHSS